MAVSVSAEDESAEGAHEKTCAEGHERKHEGAEGGIAGEKGCADGGSEVAKDHEVVHLQEISAGDADDGPDLGITIRGIEHGALLDTIVHDLCSRPKEILTQAGYLCLDITVQPVG